MQLRHASRPPHAACSCPGQSKGCCCAMRWPGGSKDCAGGKVEGRQVSGARREEVSAAHLTLGLQCGGSDAWSGITANPALGHAARAADDGVRAALLERLAWWHDYIARHGAELNNNPSPGNIAGGLTTILEKSLGAVAKSGSSPLRRVYHYAEPIMEPGLAFMDSPGYDPCSATGQMASGANILAFTTGRGSVFGSKPAPCLKLASNSDVAWRMDGDMDIDCSPVLESGDFAGMGERIFAALVEIASGRRSKSEELGFGDLEFVPWQIGPVV